MRSERKDRKNMREKTRRRRRAALIFFMRVRRSSKRQRLSRKQPVVVDPRLLRRNTRMQRENTPTAPHHQARSTHTLLLTIIHPLSRRASKHAPFLCSRFLSSLRRLSLSTPALGAPHRAPFRGTRSGVGRFALVRPARLHEHKASRHQAKPTPAFAPRHEKRRRQKRERGRELHPPWPAPLRRSERQTHV